MSLATLFKAGMLPICAIIISLAPFTTFSQPQPLLLAQNYNSTLSNIISHASYVDSSMVDANASIASNFYMWSENYHQSTDAQGADQAIASLGIQAKPKSWMLTKGAWVETKEEEKRDAMWDIVTRKGDEGTTTAYSLDKFDFAFTDPTASSALASIELIDMLAIVLLVDVFGLSYHLNRNRSLKLAHIVITYAMAYCLLLK